METKSFKKIMEELGFKEDASFETKKAFLKHLFKTAALQEEKLRAMKSARALEDMGYETQLNLFDQDKDKIA